MLVLPANYFINVKKKTFSQILPLLKLRLLGGEKKYTTFRSTLNLIEAHHEARLHPI